VARVTDSEPHWAVEPLFAGQTVFCLASGPSLTAEMVGLVMDRPTIVVNSSALLAPWATVLYFTDSSWYEQHRDLVAEFPGLVVTMSRTAKRELPDKVRRIKMFGDPDLPAMFPPVGSGLVRQGRSSGHTAIALAIAMGARRVVLLGYDCRVVDGREHHHDDYLIGGRVDYPTEKEDPRWNNKREYSTVFVRGYYGWKLSAAAAGVEILNATPGSAITEFDRIDLRHFLATENEVRKAIA
jgi:hypothetical protein